MKCYHHPDRDAVATCSICGKALCKECTDRYSPIMCGSCYEEVRAEYESQESRKKRDFRRYSLGDVLSSLIYLAIGFGLAWLVGRFFDYCLKQHIFTYYFFIFIFLPFALRTAILNAPEMGRHFSVGCLGRILWFGVAIVFPPLHYLYGVLDGSVRIWQSMSNKKWGLSLGILYAVVFLAITLFACVMLRGDRMVYLKDNLGFPDSTFF